MSHLSESDGGDLYVTLKKHQRRKQWLQEAERWLSSDRDVLPMCNRDIRHGDGPVFYFDIPRSIWEPQLRQQVEEAKRQIAEMDRIAREYVEAALRL